MSLFPEPEHDRHVHMKLRATPDGGAIFSDDRRYRYRLWRTWMPGDPRPPKTLVVIGLNPSTADEVEDDPTIRRCVGYGKRWGCTGLIMLNLFARRSTDPRTLYDVEDPVGPDNDAHIRACTAEAGIILAAWGAHGHHQGRGQAVRALLADKVVECLGVTQSGEPKHPLYLCRTAERRALATAVPEPPRGRRRAAQEEG